MTIPPEHPISSRGNNHPGKKPKRCALCDKPAVVTFRPFCSDRCRLVDLNRWLSGVYTVPLPTDDGGESPPLPSDE